jgi:hypothetical protein
MLPRPDAPATRLPYTTADMGERLAKKKAEQEAVAAAQANQALRFGVTNPPAPAPEPKKSGGGWLSQVGNMAKSLVLTPAGTLADMIPGVAMIPGVKGEGVWGYEPEDAGTTNFFQAGGQGLEQAGRRAVGDITAIKGIGKPSASPTAAGIRQKGWFEGLGEAVLDYGNLAATAAPLAGPAVKGIQGIRGARVATEIPYTYGIHVSPTADLAEIQARQAMQQQAMAGDAMAGSSYMWDARSPQTIGSIFDNPQLNPAANPNLLMTPEELAALPQPNLYVTRAPAGQVVQDANVPGSSALRVGGNQEVLAQVPFDRASLQAAMEQYAGPTRSATADTLEAQYRGLNPTVKADIANRPYQLAEENLRQVISRGTNPYFEKNFPGLSKLDPNAPIGELLRDPDARKLFEEYRGIDPTKVESMVAPEPPPSRLAPPAWRERQVPTSSRLTVETIGSKNFDGTPLPNGRQEIIIRSFDQKTGTYTGALTISYNPYTKKATVEGMGATNPMVTPQLISAAATEIRKLAGDVQYPLVPSSNLSAYSRPFVERLQQAGLVDPDYQLPAIESINDINKLQGPEKFAGPNGTNQVVLDPFSYQPTYNDVLRALAESKRQAKLAGETGRLSTSSSQLQNLKFRPPGLNDAAAYRANMRQFDIPEHPLLNQMSDSELDSFMGEIFTNPGSAAQKLIDMWEKIKPSQELGIWADSYANTLENLKKFPDILKDAYLINEASRIRLMSQLENILLKLPEDEIFS